jgi:hypothetical protein
MDSPVKQLRLLDQVRTEIRTRHYSLRTEQSYIQWIRRYIDFGYRQILARTGKGEKDSVTLLPDSRVD